MKHTEVERYFAQFAGEATDTQDIHTENTIAVESWDDIPQPRFEREIIRADNGELFLEWNCRWIRQEESEVLVERFVQSYPLGGETYRKGTTTRYVLPNHPDWEKWRK